MTGTIFINSFGFGKKKSGFFFTGFLCLLFSAFLAGCSVNPATGDKQFTALMPASREASIGAAEHEKVKKAFGEFMGGEIAAYVNTVGRKVAANTERSDVEYKFFVLDSPIVNAFAIPGGYVYVSRGLLELANSEAELAAVLAHEIGHITARHSAERMSSGFLVSLGATIASAAVKSPELGRAIGLGSNLFMSSYSRGQESEADRLGVRYLYRAGYDPFAMASFLHSLERHTDLESRLSGGKGAGGFDFFSTHPRTADRVAVASSIAAEYPKNTGNIGRNIYLSKIDGLVYGDNSDQGFVRGTSFYHPGIGFTFSVPEGYRIVNKPDEVIAVNRRLGTVIVFDAGGDNSGLDAYGYLTRVWLKDGVTNAQRIRINGFDAATAAFTGTVNGRKSDIRVVAIEWSKGRFFRFMMAMPPAAGEAVTTGLRRTTYSFRRMSEEEKRREKPYRIKVVTARAGDSIASLSAMMAYDDYKKERFVILNGLRTGEKLIPGREYKVIVK